MEREREERRLVKMEEEQKKRLDELKKKLK